MQEDFKKNFVLLSKVAKEKKYAQEYLGLLARRGDIGSIRIGKRWYTKMEWFEEFCQDAEKRKQENKFAETLAKPAESVVVKKKEEFVAEKKGQEEKFESTRILINNKIPKQPKLLTLEKKINIPEGSQRVEINSFRRAEKRMPTIDLRNTAPVRTQSVWKGTGRSGWEKESDREKWNENIKLAFRNAAEKHSPSFSPETEKKVSLFPKFAFGAVFVLMFLLLFQIGFLYKKEILRMAGFEKGIVAGAQNDKVNNFVISGVSENYLESQSSLAKEKISLSRVILRAAVERDNEQ